MNENQNIDINALRSQLGLDDISTALKTLNESQKAQKEAEEKAAKDKAEQERIKALIEGATGDQRKALEAANETVKALEGKLQESGKAFADALEAMQEQVKSQSNEINQLVAARTGMPGANIGALRYAKSEDLAREVENVVFLSYLTEKGLFDTKYGRSHQKAVNGSSSIEVSSEAYETTFSTNLLRDIQKALVVGDLFTELPMNSKNLTMLVDPEAGTATWVDNSHFGTEDSTGGELPVVALGEMTFTTFKLAAKIFMTDETEEDAILPLLPILRRHLIESHAKAIENAFMNGTGIGVPTGLLKFAEMDGRDISTPAKANGSVKVTALEITKMRRHLGRYGYNVNKLTLIVSLDAYYDLLEDPEWQDVNQVGDSSVKLQGQVGRIYGMPVVISEYFPEKAEDKEYAVIVYTDNFVVPRQRQLTVEKERQAGKQRDAYYATQRLNLQRMFPNGVVSAKYSATA